MPPQACSRNRKDQLAWASCSQGLGASPLLPQTAFLKDTLSLPFLPNCQLSCYSNKHNHHGGLPCGCPSSPGRAEELQKPSEPLPCHRQPLRPTKGSQKGLQTALQEKDWEWPHHWLPAVGMSPQSCNPEWTTTQRGSPTPSSHGPRLQDGQVLIIAVRTQDHSACMAYGCSNPSGA